MNIDNNYQDLAKKMVARVKQIKYQHPGASEEIDNLQKKLYERLVEMAQALSPLSEREKDILTLLIINEIHKIVDGTFSEDLV